MGNNKKRNEEYTRDVKNGICPSCKTKLGEHEKFVRCSTCRKERRESYKYIISKKLKNGECIRCGSKRENLELKHCEKCLEHFRQYSTNYYYSHKEDKHVK